MRDIKRIYKIMKVLTEIWEENPDWRFGQLISNVFGEIMQENEVNDIFFPEDNFWLQGLEKYKKQHSIWNFGKDIKFGGEK